MKSFKEIYEARKNPELNPKISAYEYLKPYSNDPDVYIGFTEINKLGVNPNSKFSTPLGLYFYPLQEIWDFYQIDHKKSLKVLPFGAERPWIWIVRAKNVGDSFINNLYSDFGSNDYDNAYDILKTIWDEEAPKQKKMFISYDYDADVQFAIQSIDKYEDIIVDMKPEDPESPPAVYNKFVFKLQQAKNALISLELDRERMIKGKMWEELEVHALETARSKSSVSSFWNLTRLIAMRLSGSSKGLPMATKWNWLLRKCGYTGFADKDGKGIIHPSEPLQAVFLTRQAFEIIDKIQNKDYNTNKNTLNTLESIVKFIDADPIHDVWTQDFLYFLAKRDIKHSDNSPISSITETPYNIITNSDFYVFKEFLLYCLRYAKKYTVNDKKQFIVNCRILRSKYSVGHSLDAGINEWNVLNNIILRIDEELNIKFEE